MCWWHLGGALVRIWCQSWNRDWKVTAEEERGILFKWIFSSLLEFSQSWEGMWAEESDPWQHVAVNQSYLLSKISNEHLMYIIYKMHLMYDCLWRNWWQDNGMDHWHINDYTKYCSPFHKTTLYWWKTISVSHCACYIHQLEERWGVRHWFILYAALGKHPLHNTCQHLHVMGCCFPLCHT